MSLLVPAQPPRRAAVIREMELGPLWLLRSRDAARAEAAASAKAAALASTAETVQPAIRPSPAAPQIATRPVQTRPQLQQPVATTPVPAEKARAQTDPVRERRIAALDWEELESEIRSCQACVLCERRKQAVPGVGDRKAQWMLVGEGPGAEEDLRGEPFVGQAGKLLDNMLAAVDLKRGDGVYIANAVKCRPPHNRTPETAEIDTCLPFLARQIELVQPRLLVALGRPAAQALLNMEVRIGAARGQVFRYRDTPVVITYHPAYLLRNPQDKSKAWEDLCFARRTMAGLPQV